MQIDPEIVALAHSASYDAIEERWLQRLEQTPHDTEFFLGTLQALLKRNQQERAAVLVPALLASMRAQGDPRTELGFVKAALQSWPESAELRASLFEVMRRAYADRPSLERLLQHFKTAEAHEPHTALQQVEVWLSFDVGRTVLLTSRGLGQITEINLALSTLRAEFRDGTKMSFRLPEAQKLLVALEPGHFLLEKAQNPVALRERAETDAGAALEHVFQSMQKPLTASEIKELFSGVMPDARWATWWKKASAHPKLASSGGKRPTYTWSATGADADDALRSAFEKAAGRERLELARKHSGRSPEFAQLLARGVGATLQAARRDDPSLALEAALTLEKLGIPGTTSVDPGAFLDVEDPVPIVTAVEERSMRERAISLLRERREDWHELFGRLLRAETDTRTLGVLYDALGDADGRALRNRTADDVLARPHIAPRLFVWLCRELRRRPELEGKGDWALLRKLLDAQTHDAFRGLKAPLRELFDDGLGEHLASRLNAEQSEQLLVLLQREVGLEEHRKEPLRQLVLRMHVELRESGEEKLYTTTEALERKRGEFEQITRFDIPRNAEEIRVAAAHGDLRENFEYKAARDRHEMLSSRAKSLHDELRRAKALEPASIDATRIRVGTTVTLHGAKSGETKVLTILGPWDSDPANGVMSYLAPAIQAILGKSAGETVQFLDDRFEVRSIRVWRDA